MARNFFFGGGYNQQDPFQSLLQGLMAGQSITSNLNQAQTQDIKNQMLQNELAKQQAVKNSLANYGQEGFDNAAAIKGLMQAGDPETAFKLQNLQRTMNKEQIDMMASGASLAEKLAPILLQDPSQYPVVLAKTKAAGIDIGLPEWKTFFDQQGNFNAPAYARTVAAIGGGTKTLQEMLKPEPPQFLPLTYDAQGNPIQNVINKRTLAVQQVPGIQGGKDYGTETLVPLEGKGPAIVVNKRPGQAYPEGYGPMGQVRLDMGHTSPEGRQLVLKGIDEGKIPPSMLSKRAADYNEMLGDAMKMGINLNARQLQYEGAKRFVGTLNNQQNSRLRQVGGTIINTVDRVEDLAKQMDLSGFRPLNYAEIESAAKLAGNTPKGVLAQQYITQVNFLKSKFAQMESGGYAPITEAWKLANEQLKTNFGIKQMQGVLAEIRRDTGYSLAALTDQSALMPPELQEPKGNQPQGQPAQPQQTMKVPDSVIPKLQATKKGEAVDGGDGYLYRINPTDGLPERRKK